MRSSALLPCDAATVAGALSAADSWLLERDGDTFSSHLALSPEDVCACVC